MADPGEGTGKGHRGYCRICDSPAAVFLNKRYADDPPQGKKGGFNAARAQEFAATLDLTAGPASVASVDRTRR